MRIATLFAAVLAVAACAPAGTTTADPSAPRPVTIRAEGMAGSLRVDAITDPSSTPLATNAEDTYRVMPLVFDSLSIPKTWLDPKQYLISSQAFKIRARLGKTPLSRFIDCGGTTQIGPNADSYEVSMTVTSRLVPSGTTSTLKTTVEAAARPVTFNQEYTRCTSKGELEKRITATVQAFMSRQ